MTRKTILVSLVCLALFMDGVYRIYSASCMFSDVSTVLLRKGEILKSIKGYKLAESDGYSMYICNIKFTEGFYHAVAYEACGRYSGEPFTKAMAALKIAFSHKLLLTIDFESEKVLFATLTHQDVIDTNIIGGFTKQISFIDFNLKDRPQYLSDIFLRLNLKTFYEYFNKNQIVFDDFLIEPKFQLWLETDDNKNKLNAAAQLNSVKQVYLEQHLLDAQIKSTSSRIEMFRINYITNEMETKLFKNVTIDKSIKLWPKFLKK